MIRTSIKNFFYSNSIVKKLCLPLHFLLILSFIPLWPSVASAERFEDVEIRVIRPKFFAKRKRLEVGTQMNAIMNETFIYTFLASGIIGFHFTESLGIEAMAGYAMSIDKDDKRILFDDFKIKTKIFKTAYYATAALSWTPIYGKWQLPDGTLIYFDTFFSGGYGTTALDWRYSEFCLEPKDDGTGTSAALPEDQIVSYPTFTLGGGQRYFLDKKSSFRWDIRGHFINYDVADSECNPSSVEPGTQTHENITLSIGFSRFL